MNETLRRPIIVIGAARSGTKFVRDILGASEDLAVVPYDVNFIWRLGNEASADDVLAPESLEISQIEVIRKRLARAARQGGADSRRMIEKTVSNTIRVPFVDRVYPEAQIIHLIRDGRDVTESSLRQWKAPTDWSYLLKKASYFPMENFGYAWWYMRNRMRGSAGGAKIAIWGPRYAGIDNDLQDDGLVAVCARQWKNSVESALADIQQLPSERVVTVRYEDFVSGEDTVSALCSFIGLSDADRVLDVFRSRVLRDSLGKWKQQMSSEEQKIMLKILDPALRNLGYL